VRYDEEASFSDWFGYAERIGLDGVELLYPAPPTWHLVHRTHRRLAEHQLEVSMVTTDCEPVQFVDELRDAEVLKLTAFVDLAADFGSRFVRVTAGSFNPEMRETSVTKALDAAARTFERVLAHAEKAGVTLALESHPGFSVSREVVSGLFERMPSPCFGWNFDMENAYRLRGQTAFDFLNDDAIRRRLVHVHAKNFGESPDGWVSDVALDEGVNDVSAMLAEVKATGFDDWISIEFAGTTREKLARSAAFLRETWESLPQKARC